MILKFLTQTLLFSFFIGFAGNSYAQLKVKKLAELPGKMHETSGLVYYDNKYLITQNDGGNKSEIFILNTKGEYLRTIDVEHTPNEDWEDLAKDDSGNLYIGDFGNNDNKREKLYIYILKKGFMVEKGVEPEKITFSYPEQEKFPPKEEDMYYDCEAMIWAGGYIYMFTKCRTEPFTGISKVYRVPAKKGKYEAELMGQIQLCYLNWRFCSVTAADYNPQTNTLALLTYSKLYFVTNFNGVNFWEGKVEKHDINFIKQREAICFKNNSTLFMTDEYHKGLKGGNLYEINF